MAEFNPAGKLALLVGGGQRTLVVATHDEEFAEAAANRVIYCRDGRVDEV